MRIVHAVRSDGFAGVERHVARLARAQSDAGHQVVVVGGAVGPMRAELGPGVGHASATTTLDVVRALGSLTARAQVLHVHMTAAELAAAAAAPLAWLRLRALPPVVATRHFARTRGRGATGAAVSAVARAVVDAEVSISEFVAGAVERPSTVVHPGVDVRPDAPRAVAREDVVLMVQRLEDEKDGATGVRAFAASGLAEAGWRLRIAGSGSQRGALEDLAEALGVAPATEFLGHRDDVPALLDTAAIFLAPCPVEGLGLSVLEAMASGLPVVASRAGGHVELLDGLGPVGPGTDGLFEPGSGDDAGKALAALAADPAARDAYGAAEQARQRADYTLEAQVAGIDAVYRSLG